MTLRSLGKRDQYVHIQGCRCRKLYHCSYMPMNALNTLEGYKLPEALKSPKHLKGRKNARRRGHWEGGKLQPCRINPLYASYGTFWSASNDAEFEEG